MRCGKAEDIRQNDRERAEGFRGVYSQPTP
jgi:hypothetical protein